MVISRFQVIVYVKIVYVKNTMHFPINMIASVQTYKSVSKNLLHFSIIFLVCLDLLTITCMHKVCIRYA